MMMKFFKQEIRYGIYSKVYYIMLLFLILLFSIILFLNYAAVMDTYSDFQATEKFYKKDNVDDIEKDLAGEYKFEKTETGAVITNPILYDKETVSRYLYTASPKYTLSQLLESAILYFPVVFGTLGLLVAITDFRYKTIKFKTVRANKEKFGIAKQLSLAISGFIIMVISLIVSYLFSFLFYNKISATIPISEFDLSLPFMNSSSPIFLKFMFAYVISLIFMVVGYTLGIIFKNMYIGIVLIIVYMFLLPNLGVFDLKNALYYIGKKLFDYQGVVSVEHPKDGTTWITSMIVLLSVLMISFIINMFIIKKRSSFES